MKRPQHVSELRSRREHLGLTVSRVAEMTGLSDVTVRNIERGTQPGSAETLRRLNQLYSDATLHVARQDSETMNKMPLLVGITQEDALRTCATCATRPDWLQRVRAMAQAAQCSEAEAAYHLLLIVIAQASDSSATCAPARKT